MKEKVALLLGASGSVGSEILKALLAHSEFKRVILFVRKPVDITRLAHSSQLTQKTVAEMTAPHLATAVAEVLADQDANTEVFAFSALGIGAGTAKLTLEQHRAVDVSLNQAFAQAVKQSPGVKYLAFLSAQGANPKAKTTGSGAAGMPRYARVKGEAEEAVKIHGPAALGIFRPAIIRGSQHTPFLIDKIAPLFDYILPKKLHSVSTRELARAMVATSLMQPPKTGVFTYAEMLPLLR